MKQTTTKLYSVEQILDRARQLAITVSLQKGEIALQSALPISDKAKQVFHDYRSELIAYLSISDEERDYRQLLIDEPALCATCLGDSDSPESVETLAMPDDYEGFMYCANHHPAYQNLEPDTPILSENYEKPVVKSAMQRKQVV